MPELDAVRGVAVLLVVVYHGLFWSNQHADVGPAGRALLDASKVGWTGVNLFFVLSGFLIGGVLLDTRRLPAREYFGVFYARRALRILPLYYLVLVVVSGLLAAAGEINAPFFWAGVFYLSNHADAFGGAAGYPLGVLWSLAIEEQFYLVWPLVVWGCGPRRLILVCGLVCLAEPVARGAAFRAYGEDVAFSATWGRLDGLALGAMLAAVLRTGATRRRVLALAAVLAGGAVAVAVVGRPFGVATRTTLAGAALQTSCLDLFYAGGLAATLAAGSRIGPRAAGLPLRSVGRVSYGVYLTHQTVFWLTDRLAGPAGLDALRQAYPTAGMLVRLLAVGAVTLVLCRLLFRYYEAWWLRRKPAYTVPAPVGG